MNKRLLPLLIKWLEFGKTDTRKKYATMAEKKHAEYVRNKEKYLKRANRNYNNNRESILTDKRQKYIELRTRLFEILGTMQCVRCGYKSNPLGLCFDHIFGKGREERDNLGYVKFMKYYTDRPEEARLKLRVMCANCNLLIEKKRRFDLRTNTPASKHHASSRDHRDMIILGVIGKACKHCGESDQEVIVMDHPNGDGAEDRRRFPHGIDQMMYYYYRHLDEAKVKLQPLCANCNQIKMFKEKYGIVYDEKLAIVVRQK